MNVEKEIEDLYKLFEGFSGKIVEQLALVDTMRRCISVLIASHPEPQRMRAEWLARRDEWVNHEMDIGTLDHEEYRRLYTDLLAGLSKEIDHATR